MPLFIGNVLPIFDFYIWPTDFSQDVIPPIDVLRIETLLKMSLNEISR